MSIDQQIVQRLAAEVQSIGANLDKALAAIRQLATNGQQLAIAISTLQTQVKAINEVMPSLEDQTRNAKLHEVTKQRLDLVDRRLDSLETHAAPG